MPKVTLSKFMCRELVYDYLSGKLEPQRRSEFQRHLSEDPQLRMLVDRQKNAIRYIGELKKTELSKEYFTHLCRLHNFDFVEDTVEAIAAVTDNPEPAIEEPGLSFSEKYPSAVFISRRAIEAMGLAIVVFAIIKILPESIFQPKLTQEVVATVAMTEQPDVQLDEEDIDEQAMEEVKPVTSQGSNTTSNQKTDSVSKNDSNQKLAEPKKEKTEPAPVKFYLYRSVVYVDEMVKTSAEFLQFLTDRGASKAGKVKLGWEKPQARYFHFHIPDKYEKEISNFFNSRAKFKLNKITHWRKTPKDKIRVIVEIRQQQ